eukprot:8854324-Pyramimonas_sp.AAC.1
MRFQQPHAPQFRSGLADLTASPGPAASILFQSDQGLAGPTCFWNPPCEPHHSEGPEAVPPVPRPRVAPVAVLKNGLEKSRAAANPALFCSD